MTVDFGAPNNLKTRVSQSVQRSKESSELAKVVFTRDSTLSNSRHENVMRRVQLVLSTTISYCTAKAF